MKISDRVYPILNIWREQKMCAKWHDFDSLAVKSPDNSSNWDMGEYYHHHFHDAPQKIHCLTDPFCLAFDLAKKSLLNAHLFNHIERGEYTFLRLKKIYNGRVESCRIKIHNVDDIAIDFAFSYWQDDCIMACGEFVWEYNTDSKILPAGYPFCFISQAIPIPHRLLLDTLLLLLFFKYAEVDEKILPPTKRLKNFECKYVNDSSSNVSILNITHFTTIHQPNGFPVRGHFRFQPHGEGLKERKLIWIKDFMKEGYTINAKIISQDNG